MTSTGLGVFFSAETHEYGRELWRTLGRPGTTTLVADIHPLGASNPEAFVDGGNRVWFTADDGVHGRELWISDGTAVGTRLVRDLTPGPERGNILHPTALGVKLLFLSGDATTGNEPWISDGTAAGTHLVRDISPGPRGSSSGSFAVVGNVAYFAADDGVRGSELWRTDGTAAGTSIVVDLEPAGGSGPARFAVDRGRGLVYFSASTANTGMEMWRSDGTAAGTSLLRDLTPGPGHSLVLETVCAGSRLFFAASSVAQTTPMELWTSDGTTAGTHLVLSAAAGGPQWPIKLLAVGQRVVFAARDVSMFVKPWVSDGTAAGTFALANVPPDEFEVVGQDVYLATLSSLVVTDLTVAGTRLLLPSPTRRTLGDLAAHPGGGVVFACEADLGDELWTSDGTVAGTRLLADLATPARDLGSNPDDHVSAGTYALLAAQDAAHGREVWRTDGTESGTWLLVDATPGPASSLPFLGGATAGRSVFASGTPRAVYVTDGTRSGTRMVSPPGVTAGFATPLGPDRILFAGTDAAHGTEPWISDGTPQGTRLLADLVAGPASSQPTASCAVDGRQFAFFTIQPADVTLWWSDGTSAGTRKVLTHTEPTTSGGGLLAANGRVFFRPLPQTGIELWCSDGIPGNEWLVHSGIFATYASQGAIWFTDGTTPFVRRTDGTRAGTGPVLTISPGTRLAGATEDRIFLHEGVDARTARVWQSDGTPAGTRVLNEVTGTPLGFLPLGSRRMAYVTTLDQIGSERRDAGWLLDGSGGRAPSLGVLRRNTWRTAAIAPVNGRLLFTHDDGTHGEELWSIDPGATAQAVPTGCAGLGRTAVLRSSDPILGTNSTLGGDGVPTSASVVSVWLGAPHRPFLRVGPCALAGTLDAAIANFLTTAPAWSRALAIPGDVRLLDLQVMLQAAWGPTDGPLGLDLTNGVLLTLGR